MNKTLLVLGCLSLALLGTASAVLGKLSDRHDLASDQVWTLVAPPSIKLTVLSDAVPMADEKPPFRIELKQPLKANERAIIWHSLNTPLTEGTALKIRLKGQADHPTSIRFGVSDKLMGDSIVKTIEPIELGPEAHDDFRTFEMPAAKPGQYFFWFDLGNTPAKIDLSQIHLYVERVRISDEQARVLAKVSAGAVARRIDLYRRGTMTIAVLSKSGTPASHISVRVEQVRHEFPFGASARNLKLNSKDSVSRASEKSFLELFNAVAVPFYWKDYQPSPNGPSGVLQDSILQWAKKNQLVCFAQGLVSAGDYPSWQPQSPAQMTAAIRNHIVSIVKQNSDKVPVWSIYDDVTTNTTGDAKSAFRAWINSLGGINGAIQRSLEWSRAAAPNAGLKLELSQGTEPIREGKRSLAIATKSGAREKSEEHDADPFEHHAIDEHRHGDFDQWREHNMRSGGHRHDQGRPGMHERDAADEEWERMHQANGRFKTVVETLQSEGARIDLLGMRVNMRQMPIAPTDIWKGCSLLSQMQIPLQIDEVAVLSGDCQNGYPPPSPWASTKEGEEDQSKQIVEAYRILFSHRSVRAIYYLNICDRESLYHAPYGLLRSDGTPKPAFKALLTLLHHTWWTQASGKTDDKGMFSTRAYWGDYNIVVEIKGKAIKLPFKFSSSGAQSPAPLKVTLPD